MLGGLQLLMLVAWTTLGESSREESVAPIALKCIGRNLGDPGLACASSLNAVLKKAGFTGPPTDCSGGKIKHDKDCRGVVKTINTLLDGSDVSCNGRFLQFAKWNCREKIAALNTALNGGE